MAYGYGNRRQRPTGYKNPLAPATDKQINGIIRRLEKPGVAPDLAALINDPSPHDIGRMADELPRRTEADLWDELMRVTDNQSDQNGTTSTGAARTSQPIPHQRSVTRPTRSWPVNRHGSAVGFRSPFVVMVLSACTSITRWVIVTVRSPGGW